MIIKRRFKDYYDHVPHLYGGGDPNIVYIRDRLVPFDKNGASALLTVEFKNLDKIKRTPDTYSRGIFYNYDAKWLVVNGCYYLILKDLAHLDSEYKLFTAKNFPDLWVNYMTREIPFYLQRDFNYTDHSLNETLLELSRQINTPVFTIAEYQSPARYGQLNIDPEIPNLGNLGMAAIMSPQQIYQEIAYFISNTIKVSPDLMPPTTMTNIEKIEQHGFDKKISFRHRK
jgi:hypothetical protein